MTSYVLSPKAQSDLDAIWDYTAERWDTDQAELYVRRIKSALESIASNPRRGRACEHVRPGYSKYPVGSHVVFYRLTEQGVDVVRIVHQRMDFSRHL